MRFALAILSCLSILAGPAIATEIFSPNQEWPVPPAPESSGFDPNWQWVEDPALLLRLADRGDPAARLNAYQESLTGRCVATPERRRQWRDAMAQMHDPALAHVEVDEVFAKLAAGNASADEIRQTLRREPQLGRDDYGDILDALDLNGGIPADPKFCADVWLAQRARGNDRAALGAVCRRALTPRHGFPDRLGACDWAARLGDADAAYRMGLAYQRRPDDFGQGFVAVLNRTLPFRPNLTIALRYYRQAAAAGHAGAQARLAHLTAIGRGLPRDDARALRLAQDSAAQDNPEGLAVLGLMTLQGWGRIADVEAGAALIRKAAERGNRMAQYSMSTLSVRGLGVERDWIEGLAWLRLLHLDLRDTARGDVAPEEWGGLTVEPWPRTVQIGNYFRQLPDGDLESTGRAVTLRKRLAAEGLWPY